MSFFEVALLGLIQGLTEFFPVSSSGHLALFQHVLGFEDLESLVFFNLILHLGTLCSIFTFYGSQILELFATQRSRLAQLCVATVPLLPIAIFLKPVESVFGKPQLLGYFFLLTAGILYLGIRFGHEKNAIETSRTKWRDSLVIGIFQALAILPGVSRSGSTISGARLLGWSSQEALSFSFLLAIPAIFGGTALKLVQFYITPQTVNTAVPAAHYLAGFTASYAAGCCALHLLQSARTQQFLYFAWYCLGLGLATILYFSV